MVRVMALFSNSACCLFLIELAPGRPQVGPIDLGQRGEGGCHLVLRMFPPPLLLKGGNINALEVATVCEGIK